MTHAVINITMQNKGGLCSTQQERRRAADGSRGYVGTVGLRDTPHEADYSSLGYGRRRNTECTYVRTLP